MATTPIALATKDSASGQLSAGINNSVLSIPLLTGNGANFPQPYSGTATSGGTATTLNCTGISATVGGSAVVGKPIMNLTDNSLAYITAVGTNSITTTRLLGGTSNTWGNSQVWAIDPFVATLAVVSTSSYGVQSTTQSEEILVTGRSTDTLTVATAGRGYNGTTANTFSANDYCYLLVTSPVTERLKEIISVIAQQQDTDRTTLATASTNIGTLQDGTYHYVVTTGSANAYVAATPALSGYSPGNLIVMKANFANTGAATLNVNGLGAINIKKNGATALVANDILNGQVVVLRNDGTAFQMLSPTGTPATSTYYSKTVYLGASDGNAAGGSSTAVNYMDTHNYTIPANDLVSGVAYEYEFAGTFIWAAGALGFNPGLGSTDLTGATSPGNGTPSGAGRWMMRGIVYGTAAAGGAVQVRTDFTTGASNCSVAASGYSSNATVATNGTLVLQAGVQYGSSNAGNGAKITMAKITKVSTTPFT